MQLGAGTTLQKGNYLLNHVLDQQGIGWTYRATQTQRNQSVILKTLNPIFRSHPDYLRICQDFERRSDSWAKLRHPGLVRVLDFFYEGDLPQGLPFVVIEEISGRTLGDRLSKETLSEVDIIALLRQAASALTHAQENGLVHGNLRPRNIIRRQESQDYVLVGSAISLTSSLFERRALQNPYAAPELAHGKLTSSADLYSLGAVLYTCLSGHSPILAPPEAALTDRLPLLSLLKPGAVRLLRSAMTSVISDRPVSPEAWLALLAPRSAPVAPVPVISITPPVALPVALPVVQPPISPVPSPITPPETLPRYRTDPLPSTLAPTLPIHPLPLPQPRLPKHSTQGSIPSSAQPSTFNLQPSTFKLPPRRSLILTAGIAATCGTLFGLVLRFHAAQRPGASLFHTGQSFPVRVWKGTLTPSQDDAGDIPIESPTSSPNRSSSTGLNTANNAGTTLGKISDKSDNKLTDTSSNLSLPPSISAPNRSESVATSPKRRRVRPIDPSTDPLSDNLATGAPRNPLPRSVIPEVPIPDPIPESAPQVPDSPRSAPSPRSSPKMSF